MTPTKRLSDRLCVDRSRAVLVACVIALVASGCSGSTAAIEDPGVTLPAFDSALPPTPTAVVPASPTDCLSSAGARIEAQLTTSDGVDRNYLLLVPEGVSAAAPIPVVIDFHGAGSSALQQTRVSEFETLGRREQFAVITPEALAGRWTVEDIPFVEQMIEDVGAAPCIDGTRVFAAGMSNGGFFASRLACNLADRIIAIGTVTGISYPGPCDQDRPVSIIHFHGLADSIMHFEPIPDAIDQWAQALGCEQAASVQVTPSIEVQTHSDCDAHTTVHFYQVENGGHTWPGSEETERFEDTLGVTNNEIDATRLIWEFFTAAEDRSLSAIGYEISQRETSSGLRYWVAMPDDGTTPATRPVLYHLHGATLTWKSLEADVEHVAAMFTRHRTSAAPIIVAPHDPSGWSMWSDSIDGVDAPQQLIVNELIPEIERRHGASADAESRWLQGFSMGGFGAASLGLRHPDRFGKIAIWDGAMHDWQTLTDRRPRIASHQFGDDETYFERWSPWNLAASNQGRTAPMLLIAGSLTDWYYTYLAHLAENDIDTDGIVSPCGHNLGCIADEEGAAIVHFYENET